MSWQRPRSKIPRRSLPRSAACALAASLAVGPESAFSDVRLDLIVDAWGLPSQHLTRHVLRQPLEFAQYTSEAYTNVLTSHGIRSSLSRPADCWDNAVAESFFSTLKLDLLYRHSWPTRAAARSAIFEYIEVFYNRERRHSTLGNLSPADYESDHAAVCSA
jgi:transposase InsO family protein